MSQESRKFKRDTWDNCLLCPERRMLGAQISPKFITRERAIQLLFELLHENHHYTKDMYGDWVNVDRGDLAGDELVMEFYGYAALTAGRYPNLQCEYTGGEINNCYFSIALPMEGVPAPPRGISPEELNSVDVIPRDLLILRQDLL